MPESNQAEEDERQLIACGWQLATISSGEHLKRTLQMYKELGLSTKLVVADPYNQEQCTICYRSAGEPIYKVYTRAFRDEM